jgi:hypothetical protein
MVCFFKNKFGCKNTDGIVDRIGSKMKRQKKEAKYLNNKN